MVHAGFVFVASIHLSRTWMSGSFESVQQNANVHRLDLGLYSHPKIETSFGGMESELMLTPREKSPLPEAQRMIEPMTLHHAGQGAQHTTDWAIAAPSEDQSQVCPFQCWHLIYRPRARGHGGNGNGIYDLTASWHVSQIKAHTHWSHSYIWHVSQIKAHTHWSHSYIWHVSQIKAHTHRSHTYNWHVSQSKACIHTHWSHSYNWHMSQIKAHTHIDHTLTVDMWVKSKHTHIDHTLKHNISSQLRTRELMRTQSGWNWGWGEEEDWWNMISVGERVELGLERSWCQCLLNCQR